MQLYLEAGRAAYTFDLAAPIEISAPMDFWGPQPSLFGVPAAASLPYAGDGWLGDTRQGSGCNFHTVTITPHCNGTHTEGVGHVVHGTVPVAPAVDRLLWRATLVTLQPVPFAACAESYEPTPAAHDVVLTAQALANALQPHNPAFAEALVVRTLPNPPGKALQAHPGTEPFPPFFTNDALRFIAEKGFRHLVVDLPSVDRLLDEGRLANHRVFWNLPPTGHALPPNAATLRTITELAYIPNALPDGPCLLSLQIPNWQGDAAPSRAWLFLAV